MKSTVTTMPHLTMDIRNLIAPVTCLRVENQLKAMKPGQVLQVVCTDEETKIDLEWIAKNAGHGYYTIPDEKDMYRIFIHKK